MIKKFLTNFGFLIPIFLVSLYFSFFLFFYYSLVVTSDKFIYLLININLNLNTILTSILLFIGIVLLFRSEIFKTKLHILIKSVLTLVILCVYCFFTLLVYVLVPKFHLVSKCPELSIYEQVDFSIMGPPGSLFVVLQGSEVRPIGYGYNYSDFKTLTLQENSPIQDKPLLKKCLKDYTIFYSQREEDEHDCRERNSKEYCDSSYSSSSSSTNNSSFSSSTSSSAMLKL